MMRQHTKSVGAVVLNPQDQALFMFRADMKFWELPKEKAIGSESELETLKRGLFEETGITRYNVIDPFKEEVTYSFKLGDEIIDRTIVFYLVRTEESVRLSREHTDFKWLSIPEAQKVVRFDNYRRVLEAAKKYISS